MTCASATSVLAEEHRQHGAHEHGGGQLNVAVEKNQLMINLSLPAMNVVGFEHAAGNKTERELISRAVQTLKDGITLFSPDSTAQCKQISSNVESALLEDEGTDEHEHQHEHEHDGEHADFDVDYEFNCANPAQLTTISLSLFKRFKGTQHLRAQVITPTRQGAAELTASNNILKLK